MQAESSSFEDTTPPVNSPVGLRFPARGMTLYNESSMLAHMPVWEARTISRFASRVTALASPLRPPIELIHVKHSDTTRPGSSPLAATLFAGTLCLMVGFVLAVMVLTARLNADWGVLGRVVTRNPVMCWGMSIGLMLAGAVLVKQHPTTGEPWSPRIPGRRFRNATLYTRKDCTLCEEALMTLSAYRSLLPPVETVDIDSESGLSEDFGHCVPVLMLDDRIRFRGHINERMLRRLIEGAPPVSA